MLLLIVSMPRKSGLGIKKAIVEQLRKHECSLRELETKTNTGYAPIKKHCQELAFFDIIELVRCERSAFNGRPYTVARLTQKGRELFSKAKWDRH